MNECGLGEKDVAKRRFSLFEKTSSRRRWAVGFGLGAPAVALCTVLIMFLFIGPAAQMQLRVNQNLVRSGGILRNGDKFHLEISAARDGFVFVYAHNEKEGGNFIYPEANEFGKNAVRKGEKRVVPDGLQWQMWVTAPGEEIIYLLFSPTMVDSAQLSRIGAEVSRGGKDRQKVELELKKHFSVEQEISYTGR